MPKAISSIWMASSIAVMNRYREHLSSLTRWRFAIFPYRFVTNNSTSTPEQYVVKLAGMGIDTTADLILTSGVATRHYLHDSMPEGGTVFAIGEPALMEQLYVDPTLRAPADLTSSIDAVVVGLDREFTYAKLFRANAAIRGGARYVATNTDATLPTEQGLVPGCGSILAAVTASVGMEPEVVGKPETLDVRYGVCGHGYQRCRLCRDRRPT